MGDLRAQGGFWMSYTRNYTKRIVLSGYVTYPASEDGGSMPVTLEDIAEINVTVMDEDFNQSVLACNAGLGLVGAGITAAKLAQIQSRKESSKAIATTLVKGFYNNSRVELSQSLMDNNSRFTSAQAKLMQYQSQLDDLKSRMDHDYHMIASRYLKTFDEMDKELSQQLEELNGACFRFSRIIKEQQKHHTISVGKSFVFSQEIQPMQIALGIASLKRKALEAIRQCSSMLRNHQILKRRMEDIVTDAPPEKKTWYIPVLLMDTGSEFSAQGKDLEKFPKIQETVRTGLDPIGNSVRIPQAEMPLVETEFLRLVGQDSSDEQEKRQIMQLWQTFRSQR
jgi:hypothetical protein